MSASARGTCSTPAAVGPAPGCPPSCRERHLSRCGIRSRRLMPSGMDLVIVRDVRSRPHVQWQQWPLVGSRSCVGGRRPGRRPAAAPEYFQERHQGPPSAHKPAWRRTECVLMRCWLWLPCVLEATWVRGSSTLPTQRIFLHYALLALCKDTLRIASTASPLAVPPPVRGARTLRRHPAHPPPQPLGRWSISPHRQC